MLSIVSYFYFWLLLILVVFGLITMRWRMHFAGKIILALNTLLLIIIFFLPSYTNLSWRLLPAWVAGYHYNPQVDIPDPELVDRPPELLLARQLEALLGKTDSSPLDPDFPLVHYQINKVSITQWQRFGPRASLETTLTFADGKQQIEAFVMEARGGAYVHVPFAGEFTRSAGNWVDLPLTHLLKEPAAGSSLESSTPPVKLQFIQEIDTASTIEQLVDVSLVSDVARDGRILFDSDLRTKEGTHFANAFNLITTDGKAIPIRETFTSARGLFSPSGNQIAYIDSSSTSPQSLDLIVQAANGIEQEVSAVDTMTHHWISDNQVVYSQNDTAYLYTLSENSSLSEKPLVSLPSSQFTMSHYFRVSSGANFIAYTDLSGRLWVKDVNNGQQYLVGWDVYEVGWGAGMAWDESGERLAYSTVNNVTLPGQTEVWVWDANTKESTLIARDGTGFLNESGLENGRFGKICWADEETILFMARFGGYQERIYLLAGKADGNGVWDITPEGIGISFPGISCANQYVTINTSRTKLTLYKILD